MEQEIFVVKKFGVKTERQEGECYKGESSMKMHLKDDSETEDASKLHV